MKIEKINDNQIRCTLNRQDLQSRELRISELAYGTQKAKELFKDMIEQADQQFGFSAEDMPLMIEAIPVSMDCIVLIITKVEDPDELDTRFSKFTASNDSDADSDDSESNTELSDLLSFDKDNEDRPDGLDGLLKKDSTTSEAPNKEEMVHIDLSADAFIPFAESLKNFVETIADSTQNLVKGFVEDAKNAGYSPSSEAPMKNAPEEDSFMDSSETDSLEDLSKDTEPSSCSDFITHLSDVISQYVKNSSEAEAGDLGNIAEASTPSEEVPSEEAPTNEVPLDEIPLDETPADEVPADEVPADEFPADEVPTEETPADEVLADESPADEPPKEMVHRLYSFERWDEVAYAALHISSIFEGESILYKDNRDGTYYLSISGYPDEQNHFFAVSNELAEFGKKVKITFSTGAYLAEHCRVIIRENALAILKEYA